MKVKAESARWTRMAAEIDGHPLLTPDIGRRGIPREDISAHVVRASVTATGAPSHTRKRSKFRRISGLSSTELSPGRIIIAD